MDLENSVNMKTLLKTNHGLFKLIPILGILIVFAKQFDAQSDFNINVTLGGAAGISRTDFVDHNYLPFAIRNQRLVNKGFSFYAHPEISIYIEHHQLFGLKLSSWFGYRIK